MLVNIIHDPLRTDRHILLMKEIEEQGFEYRLWDACKGSKPKTNISVCHKKIVQDAKDSNLEMVCVGEDDMKWCGNGAFDYYISKIPQDFDIYLATIMWGRILPDNTTSDWAGMQCYIVHQRYYNKFLESDETRDIDRAQTRRGIFRVCTPLACIQQETMSDNGRKTIHLNKKLYFDKVLFNGTNG